MRKRDLGILLISALAIFYSLQQKGNIQYREAWFHPVDELTNPTYHENEHLPPPVVFDLNGDGRPEILFATHDAKLQVVEAARPGSDDEGFRESRVLAEVSLSPSAIRVAAGRQPVALAAGHLEPPHGRGGGRRKGVIVVVTAGWAIMCFDHNLKLLWENNVQEEFPLGSHHKEVAILISNQTMHLGDKGVVVVGGSMEIQPQLLDPFMESDQLEEGEERHRHRAGKDEELEDVTGGAAGMRERHFSYYAYDGKSGAQRWKHDSKDFHRDASVLSQHLQPQHNYKLDANAISSRHYGEVECREFRESILGAMPHGWTHRDDTRFELAHFRKHRRPPGKKQAGQKKAPHNGPPARHLAGRDHSNKVAQVLKKVVDVATSGKKSQKAAHLPAHSGNGSHWWAANAIVVHLKEGIEAIHLYTGRTICKLHLTAGGLHADVNGDGVLDHVQATGSQHGGTHVVPGSHEPMKACWAVATSGVPITEQLFNGSICKQGSSPSLLQSGEFASRAFGRHADESSAIEVAPPTLLPRRDGHRHRKGSHGDAVFLNSRGEVTSFTVEGSSHHHHGRQRWQLATEASWAPHETPAGIEMDRVVPTLAAIPLQVGGSPEVILAAGESTGVLLSAHGVEETMFNIPMPPIAPLVVVDFNNDGLLDIIAVTSVGLYGYVQVRQPGATLFSALLGSLIVGILAVFLTQSVSQGKGKPRKIERRSTD